MVKSITMKKNIHQSVTGFICNFLKPYKFWVAAYILFAILAGLWMVLNSILIKVIVDTLTLAPSNTDTLQLLFWPSILFILNLISFDIFWRCHDLVNYKIQPLIKNDIIEYSFAYMGKQAYQFFQNNFTGKISSNINILASGVNDALTIVPHFIIACSVQLIVSLIAMYYVNPQFFWGLSIWTLIFLAISLKYSQRIISLSSDLADRESDVSGVIVDSIGNSQSVRMFARNKFELANLYKSLLIMRNKYRDKVAFLIKFNIVQGFSIAILMSFMLYTLIKLRTLGAVTIGDFALVLTLGVDVAWSVWWLTEQATSMIDAIGRCKNSINSLFLPLEIEDKPNASTLKVTAGRIVFDTIHFSYPGSEPLFQNKSIVIEPGQKVGLVGYSGSGKTTFVNLILRLYDLNSGSILIDGQNIKDVTQASLHNAVGMIPQDPSLFHRSLRDNILYADLNATEQQMIVAAKRAHAHDFIEELPEQYASLVGERGIRLSGGQRQRIAIARAMLKNAPILILDEATSQLDSITEHKIQEALWDLMQGKTSIVIAHRLSTLLHMDRILVFDKGKIVEDGTHQELLAKRGLYSTLWDAQVGGFLPDSERVDN